MLILRSLLFNVAFYVHIILWMIGADSVRCRCRARPSCGPCRPGRGPPSGCCGSSPAPTVEFRGLERIPPGGLLVASKHQSMLGDLRAPDDVRRPDLHPQARADVDPVLRLVHREGGAWCRSTAAPASAALVRHERARPRGGGSAGARSSSSRKARAAPPARRRPTSSASPISTRTSTCPACRSRSTPASTGRAAASSAGPAPSVIEILDPIPPGLPRKEFMDELQTRLEAASARLLAEGTARLREATDAGSREIGRPAA